MLDCFVQVKTENDKLVHDLHGAFKYLESQVFYNVVLQCMKTCTPIHS